MSIIRVLQIPLTCDTSTVHQNLSSLGLEGSGSKENGRHCWTMPKEMDWWWSNEEGMECGIRSSYYLQKKAKCLSKEDLLIVLCEHFLFSMKNTLGVQMPTVKLESYMAFTNISSCLSYHCHTQHLSSFFYFNSWSCKVQKFYSPLKNLNKDLISLEAQEWVHTTGVCFSHKFLVW